MSDEFEATDYIQVQRHKLTLAVTYLEELTGVLVSIIDSNTATVDANVKANTEVLGHEWLLGTVWLQHHLSLQEGTLGSTRVDLLGLSNHDRFIFQEVENSDLADAVVLETAFNNALFEITTETEHLY